MQASVYQPGRRSQAGIQESVVRHRAPLVVGGWAPVEEASTAHEPGAQVHGLRYTFATELSNSEVGVYALMNLPGHEAMSTAKRYMTVAGSHNRQAAAQDPLYAILQNYRASGS